MKSYISKYVYGNDEIEIVVTFRNKLNDSFRPNLSETVSS